MSDIKRDIAFQVPVEMQIAWMLARRCGGLVLPNQDGENASQDFTVYIPHGVEVKTDYKADQTKNLYFETFNPYRNKPSGLSATKAKWWAHYVPGLAVLFIYSPARMLAWLQSTEQAKYCSLGGDKNSAGYICPIADVLGSGLVTEIECML